jgi:choice-of-anchor C domain-containing protein
MRIPVVFATLLLSTAFILSASPFSNGSFETSGPGCDPVPGAFNTFAAGNPCINGWSISGGNIDYINGFWTAADGTHSLDMNGDTGPGSAVQQMFDTISGAQYLVSFSLAGNPGGVTIKTLHVDAAGQSANYNFDITGRSLTNMGWTTEAFNFTANSSSTLLTFTSTTVDPAQGPALDNVSVTALGTVPEPASTGLLAAGVALIILGRGSLRRRLL